MWIDRDAAELDPNNPCDAQIILFECLRVERLQYSNSSPQLPYPKETLETALRTAARALSATGRLNEHVIAYLKQAYVALRDDDNGESGSAA